MAKNSCQLNVSCTDGILTASLCGELDHHGAVAVRTLIECEIQRQNPQKTVLDLTDLDFMDSSGLGLIMGRYALMQKLGGDFIISNPSDRVQRIFELSGLGRIIKIEKSKEKEAVK